MPFSQVEPPLYLPDLKEFCQSKVILSVRDFLVYLGGHVSGISGKLFDNQEF